MEARAKQNAAAAAAAATTSSATDKAKPKMRKPEVSAKRHVQGYCSKHENVLLQGNLSCNKIEYFVAAFILFYCTRNHIFKHP